MKTSSFHKVRQSESYLEYKIWSGNETAGRYFLFSGFFFLLLLTFLGIIEVFNRGIKNNNIIYEFSIPENLLLIIGPFFLFLAMTIGSTKAWRNPYLIILDAEAHQVTYRSYFNIRLNKIPLAKLKGLYCKITIKSSANKGEKIITYVKIIFIGGSHLNQFVIEGLRKFPLKELTNLLQDINSFIMVNFGSEYNFQDQIDILNTAQDLTCINVEFKYPKRNE